MNSVRAVLALGLVAIGLPAPVPHEAQAGRLEYLRQVASLRTAVIGWSPPPPCTLEDLRWKARLDDLDRDLDALAPAIEGIGAPWMWTPTGRHDLEDVVAAVRPVLKEVVDLVRERHGRPLPEPPKLMWSRHRTNLLCAAAIVSDTDDERLQSLCDALDVAQCIDDGSMISCLVEECDFAIVADAAQQISRSSRRSCDRLTSDLVPRFARYMDSRDRALHLADFAFRSVDEDWIRDYEPRELREVLPALRQIEEDIRHPRRTGPIAADAETRMTTLVTACRDAGRTTRPLLCPSR